MQINISDLDKQGHKLLMTKLATITVLLVLIVNAKVLSMCTENVLLYKILAMIGLYLFVSTYVEAFDIIVDVNFDKVKLIEVQSIKVSTTGKCIFYTSQGRFVTRVDVDSITNMLTSITTDHLVLTTTYYSRIPLTLDTYDNIPNNKKEQVIC